MRVAVSAASPRALFPAVVVVVAVSLVRRMPRRLTRCRRYRTIFTSSTGVGVKMLSSSSSMRLNSASSTSRPAGELGDPVVNHRPNFILFAPFADM